MLFAKNNFNENEDGSVSASKTLSNIPMSSEYKITEIKTNEYVLKDVISENENVTIIDKYALTNLMSINNASITFYSEKEYMPVFGSQKTLINNIPGKV